MFEHRRLGKLRYLLRYPDTFDCNGKHPLIIYLHGAGSRNTSLEHLSSGCVFHMAQQTKDFPFLVAAPLCEAQGWHSLWEHLEQLIDELAALPFVDPGRIYLTGASMGGYATWQLAMTMPEKFAAVVPVCGGGMYWNAPRLKDTPVWAFHGALDKVVLPEESLKMVSRINDARGNAKLTIYPKNAHDAWTDTYHDPALYTWLLQHSK